MGCSHLNAFFFGGSPNGAPRGWKRAADQRYPCRCRANLVSTPIVRAQDQPLAAVSASQSHAGRWISRQGSPKMGARHRDDQRNSEITYLEQDRE